MELHVDSVRKQYGLRQILTDIYLSCQTGDIIGLLGKNGSGKSTLLKIIFGSEPADDKFVRIGDKRINSLSDGKNLMKYLPQDGFLPGHVPVYKIISLFCNERNARIIENNEYVKPLLNRKSRQLSGGERRLIEIFLITYSEAEFVLIDEPFNGIAPVYKEDIKKMIKEESAGKGFIITDHDYRNILEVATQVFLIFDGGIKTIRSKEDLREWGYIS